LFLGIGLVFVLIIQALIIYFIVKLIKKYPLAALFLLICMIGVGIAETMTVAGVTIGIATVTTSAIIILKNYARFKSAAKRYI
jgi:hypothetical protein